MSANVLDIVQFTINWKILGEPAQNVFHYRVITNDEPENDERLCEYFRAHYLFWLQDILSVEAVSDGITFENLTDGLSIFEYSQGFQGTGTGDCHPSFTAWGFRLNRVTKATRHGYKRFGGIPESFISNNYPVAGLTQALEEMETLLAEDIVLDVDPPGNPSIVLRPVIVGASLNAEGKYERDLTRINGVGSASFYGVTTQSSRKIRFSG